MSYNSSNEFYLAEKKRFELLNRFWRLRDFQSRALDQTRRLLHKVYIQFQVGGSWKPMENKTISSNCSRGTVTLKTQRDDYISTKRIWQAVERFIFAILAQFCNVTHNSDDIWARLLHKKYLHDCKIQKLIFTNFNLYDINATSNL